MEVNSTFLVYFLHHAKLFSCLIMFCFVQIRILQNHSQKAPEVDRYLLRDRVRVALPNLYPKRRRHPEIQRRQHVQGRTRRPSRERWARPRRAPAVRRSSNRHDQDILNIFYMLSIHTFFLHTKSKLIILFHFWPLWIIFGAIARIKLLPIIGC